jgi:plasmid stabilization system protein ParE
MKVFWTREALQNLIGIEKYIAEDNSIAAVKLTDSLIKCAESLSIHPEKGRIVPEFSIKTVRELIFHNYRIVYILKNRRIEILTVFEGHKLLNKKYFINISIS